MNYTVCLFCCYFFLHIQGKLGDNGLPGLFGNPGQKVTHILNRLFICILNLAQLHCMIFERQRFRKRYLKLYFNFNRLFTDAAAVNVWQGFPGDPGPKGNPEEYYYPVTGNSVYISTQPHCKHVKTIHYKWCFALWLA